MAGLGFTIASNLLFYGFVRILIWSKGGSGKEGTSANGWYYLANRNQATAMSCQKNVVIIICFIGAKIVKYKSQVPLKVELFVCFRSGLIIPLFNN